MLGLPELHCEKNRYPYHVNDVNICLVRDNLRCCVLCFQIVKLSCGGVGVLSPWAGGVGCLAVVSASGLATPPLHPLPSSSPSYVPGFQDPKLLNFVASTVRKCLKVNGKCVFSLVTVSIAVVETIMIV